MKPRIAVFGYFSLDRVVFDDRIHECVPGGGALYGSMAVLACGACPVPHVVCGADFPEEVLTEMSSLGVDLSQIRRDDGPSRRAELNYTSSDRRASPHYLNTDWLERTETLRPPLPRTAYDGALLGAMPTDHAARILEKSDCLGRVVLDTSEYFCRENPDAVLNLLARVEVFAPSVDETRVLRPGMDDDAAAISLATLGPIVLQKRGSAGLACATAVGIEARAEAEPTAVIDPTGAGDTVGGVAVVATVQGKAIPEILRWATRLAARTVSAPSIEALIAESQQNQDD